MKAFAVAFLFGVLEVFLLSNLMKSVTSGKKGKAFLFFAVKFVTYGVAIALLMFRYLSYAMYCFCGFAAGMPLTAILIFIYKTFFSKENDR